jgi:hypothetical protein
VSVARLPSGLEASAIIRRAESEGGFATVLHKGDPDRGALLLVITSRGRHIACLERQLAMDGRDLWNPVGPAESDGSAVLAEFLARRTRFDADLWLIELDIAPPERFIAETTSAS